MPASPRSFWYFFSSQNFSDGLRTTFTVLTPGLLLGSVGQLSAGFTVSLGALCLSIIDTPGPAVHKRNGMLAGLALLPLVAILTGLVAPYQWLLGLEVGVLSFVFTLFLVYGNRAASVGTAGLLLLILIMDRQFTWPQVLLHAGLVTLGGAWYMVVSLLMSKFRPYRPAQQALGECILAVAGFLRLKAEFYRTGTSLDDDYRRLVAQQVVVSEKQDAVRELLFKTRQMMKESTGTGRRLVLTFVDVVDLYDHITAAYYDYGALHQRFEASGVLDAIAAVIEQLASELENIGYAIQANHGYHSRAPLTAALEQLKLRIDALETPTTQDSTLVLRKILVNVRTLTQRLQGILAYFDASAPAPAGRELEFGRFVAHQRFDLAQLRDHLTLRSSIFRHAMRMMLACLVGFVVARLLLPGHHSYWILMTITYMLKPAFSLTKQRNVQRVLGTLVGGVLGALLLWLITDRLVLLTILAICMLAAFSFTRTHYLVAVSFMTPMVLILFSFIGLPYLQVVEERVLDTVVGCLIAFGASYLLFPRWESEQLQDYMRAVVQANVRYLQTLADSLAGRAIALVEYKLARKEVYVSSANLGAAFHRMLSEPQHKQHRPSEVHEFVVLNHILASNVASLTSGIFADAARPALAPLSVRYLRQAQQALQRSLRRLGAAAPEETAPDLQPSAPTDDAPLREQLEFIRKVSHDINKATDAVLA